MSTSHLYSFSAYLYPRCQFPVLLAEAVAVASAALIGVVIVSGAAGPADLIVEPVPLHQF